MSAFTEVLDRLPTPDGGVRRRFTSGILFLLIVFAGIFWFPGISGAAQGINDALAAITLNWTDLNTTGTLIILFSIVFVIGNLIDVFSYVMLNRLFFFAGGTIAYRGVQATYQSIRGQDEQGISLSKTERATYEELPSFVREGLRNPYKRQFEVAFRYLVHIAPDDEKGWLQRIDARNQNLFAVISSIFVAMLLVLILSVTAANDPRSIGGSAAMYLASLSVTAKFFGVVCAFLIPLAVIYALMLRYSITSALEMLWLRKGVVGRDDRIDRLPDWDAVAPA
jgi:hypothetical protein